MERLFVGREMRVFKLTPLTISMMALHFSGLVQCRRVQGFLRGYAKEPGPLVRPCDHFLECRKPAL